MRNDQSSTNNLQIQIYNVSDIATNISVHVQPWLKLLGPIRPPQCWLNIDLKFKDQCLLKTNIVICYLAIQLLDIIK